MNEPADSQEPVRSGELVVQRRARWFERGALDARELWIVLHGYGQLARPFLASCAPLARPERRLVAPEALSRFYLRSGRGPIGACWMTREAREDEIADYLAYLDALCAHVLAQMPLAPRLCVLGFSQGVATAWRWALAGAHAPARLIACGGTAPEELDAAALGTRSFELVVATGEHDEAFTPQAARAEHERWLSAGLRCSLEVHGRGHELAREFLARL